jgi:hypothetical protein
LSDLGEISAEVTAALQSLDRALNRFAALDRATLAPLQAELAKSPQTRQAAALIGRARNLLGQARIAAGAARGAGGDWLAQHGSSQRGRSGGGAPGARPSSPGGEPASFGSAALEAIWAGGIETPAGRAYFPPDEGSFRELAVAISPFAGEYTVDMHGTSDSVSYGDSQLDASELAELIAADPAWGGQPVRLFSCNTGRGENPIAAQLAILLGVRVTAPDDLVWSYADGEIAVAPSRFELVNGELSKVPDRSREGSWREFEP